MQLEVWATEYKREERWEASTMHWDRRVGFESKEERVEVKTKKDNDARERTE